MRRITVGKVTGFLFTAFAILFILALTLPITPIDLKSLRVNEEHYRAGDQLAYTLNRCRNINGLLDGVTYRFLTSVDKPDAPSIGLSAVPPTLASKRGCGNIDSTVPIPTGTPPGKYRLTIQGDYKVFPFRANAQPSITSSNTFEVVR